MFRTVLALSLAASISPAMAQQVCASLDDVQRMTKEHGEMPQLTGDLGDGWNIIIFATEKGETWTAVQVRPNGLACFVGVGKNLEVLWPTQPDGKDI